MSPGKLAWAEARFPEGLPLPQISKSDEEFDGVEFLDSADGIKVTELNELFEKVRDQSHMCTASASSSSPCRPCSHSG